VCVLSQRSKSTAYLLVLENLFMGGLSPSALKFDLKGVFAGPKYRATRRQALKRSFALACSIPSGKNRAQKPGGAKGRVLLDADLMQHSGGFPITLTELSKALLNRAVKQDAKFLCSLQVLLGKGKGGDEAGELSEDVVFTGLGGGRSTALERACVYEFVCVFHVQIIDYSVLVGLDYDKGEITVGIIDYVRAHAWKYAFVSESRQCAPSVGSRRPLIS
jgi:hypothetical protein